MHVVNANTVRDNSVPMSKLSYSNNLRSRWVVGNKSDGHWHLSYV